MQHPILKFQLNKNFDKQVCFKFLEHKSAGVDFGGGIMKLHPQLESAKNKPGIEQKQIISDYVEKSYLDNKEELEGKLNRYKSDWQEVENTFFIETEKIFKETEWPEGEYICYLSIFNCNPRFLHNKTFQLFFKKDKKAKSTICHELLHFIFYEYIKNLKIPENFVWDISEIFNVTILNQSEFKKLILPFVESGYPKHKVMILESLRIWEKNKNIGKWILEIIRLVEK